MTEPPEVQQAIEAVALLLANKKRYPGDTRRPIYPVTVRHMEDARAILSDERIRVVAEEQAWPDHRHFPIVQYNKGWEAGQREAKELGFELVHRVKDR